MINLITIVLIIINSNYIHLITIVLIIITSNYDNAAVSGPIFGVKSEIL